jgi:hypothetical protein
MTVPPTGPLVLDALSRERASTYLRETGGDDERALALYGWNLQVSSALWETLAVLEVVLRNTIHQQMANWCRQQQGHDRWYDVITLTRQGADDVTTAKRRALGRSANTATVPPPGKVVAELSLGFWQFLLTNAYRPTVWPRIQAAFPHHPDHPRVNPGSLRPTVGELNRIRNRIAHHEPLLHEDLARHHANALAVIRWSSPATEQWIAGLDRLGPLLGNRPA